MGRDLTPEERKEFERKRRKQIEETAGIFGMSAEEHERLYKKAVAEMDDDWEKELDAKNRAKAGIE